MADNNVVDLTDEEDKGKKEGKPAKQKNTPAPKPDKKPSASKSKDSDGKKSGGAAGVVVLVILLLLVGGFVFEEIQYNFLGMRDVFVEAVIGLDPEFVTLEERTAELEVLRAELDKREKALDSRENQLLSLQLDLKVFEEELGDREIALTPVYRLPMSEQDMADMDSLSKTYANMDPVSAAGILASLYDKQDIAAILYFMSERNAAAILAAMETRLAADLTQILLYK